MNRQHFGRLTLALALGLLASTHASALDLVRDYKTGQNLPEQLGSSFIIDQAVTGGGDSTVATAPGFFNWVTQYNNIWTVGQQVSITGLAIPIHALSTTVPIEMTSQAGNWTFTFFELNGGANPNAFDGYNFATMTGETVLGAKTATFAPDFVALPNSTDEYFVKFDTPIEFTAQSTGVAFHMWSTNTARVKINTAGATRRGVRVNLSDGVAQGGANPNFAATLAGTPVALPPPTLAHRFVASSDVPGNTNWNPVSPSQEQFGFDRPQKGDYNNDGFTNTADYTVWRDNVDTDGSVTLPAGSRPFGATGNVNDADRAYWAANYGQPATVAVNDPAVPGITQAFNIGSRGQANIFEQTVGSTQASRQNGSFELWFKPDSLAGGDQVLYEAGGTGAGSYISLHNNELKVFVKSQFAGNDQTLTTTLTNTNWTQVVAVIHNTYAATGVSADDYVDLYVNGALAISTQSTPTDVNDWAGGNDAGLGQIGGVIATGGPIVDPGDGSVNFDFKGQIAIFEYAPTAWTATEVATRNSAIRTASAAAAAAVPEPSTLLLSAVLAMGVAGVFRSRG